MTLEPHLELSFASFLEEDKFKEIAVELRHGGARVALRRRPPEGPWASLEWLIPTAVILWMTKSYLEEFLKQTGKLHADGLHRGLSRLWKKVIGPNPEIACTLVGPKGIVKPPQSFSRGVSVKMKRKDGGDAILLIPLSASAEEFCLAVDLFIDLMGDHYAVSGTDRLTQATRIVPRLDHPNFPAIVSMNPETKLLELIDYLDSSRYQKLTTHPIH